MNIYKNKYIIIYIVILAFSCKLSNTDRHKENSNDDTLYNDDTFELNDDTSFTDDCIIDDDLDDDSIFAHPPIMTNPRCDLTTSDRRFFFDICDLGNDLSGGYIAWFPNGFDSYLYFNDFANEGQPISPANDCNNPLTLGIILRYDENPSEPIEFHFPFGFTPHDAAGFWDGPFFNNFTCKNF